MAPSKFKILIFGDGGVGKTTLVNRYLTGVYTTGSITIGVDFHIKLLEIEGQEITLRIWDFAGEEKFRFLLPSYAEGSNGGIFMFDVSRYSSIKNIDEWITVFKQSMKNQEIPLIIVGGKKDLENERSISNLDAADIAKRHDFEEYMECSSKTGENVEEIFIKLARSMMQKAGLI